MTDPQRRARTLDDVARSGDVLLTVGSLMVARPDVRAAAQMLVDAAVTVVAGVRWASVTRGRDDRFETLVASDPVAIAADAVQYRLGTGPCLDAVIGESVSGSSDLAHDPRWSGFGPLVARAHGTRSVLSVRLTLHGDAHPAASLNLYGDHVDAYDDAARTLAVRLAGHASIALAAVAGREEADHLRTALDSNREIGVAMGVLMATLKVSRDHAFEMLASVSQSTNRKLRDVASDVADTGVLDPAATPRGRGRPTS